MTAICMLLEQEFIVLFIAGGSGTALNSRVSELLSVGDSGVWNLLASAVKVFSMVRLLLSHGPHES